MGHLYEALKAGMRGFKAALEPGEFAIAGRPVKCPHCGERKFMPSRALVNTRVATLFNVDWTDSAARILICAECGRIEWFLKEPAEIET
jgi:DNA-directed RNA polymerase subunit RPC12/RpoP